MRRVRAVLSVLLIVVATSWSSPAWAQGEGWQTLLQPSIINSTAAPLADGRVLLVGTTGWPWAVVTDGYTVQGTEAMALGRIGPALVTLSDGRVLTVAGRQADWFSETNVVEFYDPVTNSWSPGPALPVPAYGMVGTQLADGRVLVVGGQSFSVPYQQHAWILDLEGGWSEAAPMSYGRLSFPGGSTFQLTRLDDGRVLATGLALPSEVYDPSANTWTTVPDESELQYSRAVKLPDGRVLLLSSYQPFRARLFNPLTNSWSAAADPPPVTTIGSSSVVLPDGRVLVVGGYIGESALYDIAANSWSVGPTIDMGAGYAPGLPISASMTTNGRAIVVLQSGLAVFRKMQAPVVTATDQTLAGAAGLLSALTVDASNSSDPDGDPLVHYSLTEGSTTLAAGATPVLSAVLGVGTHALTLSVTDAMGVIGAASFTVVVTDSFAGLLDQVEACSAALSDAQSEIELLRAQLAAAFRDPSFAIPGETTGEQIENLVEAINGLNNGAKKQLYKELGGTKK